ncbi:MAG: hypothetical protein IPH18_16675 [Chitinophagaceae bacterium]|nr:hypothetical protein [Chitinophagaceae bacterium]
MRTLHELRKLLNYMIETNQIDSDTRVVVEVARELNDANKRWQLKHGKDKEKQKTLSLLNWIDELVKQKG